MNERIAKLGEQVDLLGECTPTKIPGRYVGYVTEEQILKFAELIVKECVSKLDGIGVIDRDSRTIAMKVISEHFGVEE